MFTRRDLKFSWGIAAAFAAIFVFTVSATLVLGHKYKTIQAESANIQTTVFREAILTMRELSRLTRALNLAAVSNAPQDDYLVELSKAYDFLFVRVEALQKATAGNLNSELKEAGIQLQGLISLGDQFFESGGENPGLLRDQSTQVIDAISSSMMGSVDRQYLRQRETVGGLARLLETSVVIVAIFIGLFATIGCGLVFYARTQYRMQLRWREAEKSASYLARYDALTGVPNRIKFREQAERMLADGASPMLMICDLDDFKTINDVHGHVAGDEVLKETARCLKKVAESYNGCVARLGGDEFAVLLPTTFSSMRTAAICEGLITEFGAPIRFKHSQISANLSIGTASMPMIAAEDQCDIADLQRAADIALSKAKSTGKSTYAFFDSELAAEVDRRNMLEISLAGALKNGDLSLAFQPQVNMASGHLVGFEALARWHHQGEFISPGEFIPVAEATGQIIALDLWCFKTALIQQAAWLSAGHAPLKMSTNFSSSHFKSFDVVEQVRQILEETKVPPELVVMEVTESMAMLDMATALRILEQLRAIGIVLALDDFGTGYSSLAYLRRLDLDIIKIDQSFVRDMETSQETRMILKSLVGITKGLGKRLVVEGIETQRQCELLRNMDVDFGQGYFFGRPLPVDQAEKMVANADQIGSSAHTA